MTISRSQRRWGVGLLAAMGCALAVLEGAMGYSFLFLAPGFAQHVWGTASSFIAPKTQRGYLGGIVVMQNGTLFAAECLASSTRLHRYDPIATTTKNGTTLHKETVLNTIAGGCGITYHPNGYLYSNMDDGTNGLSRIDPSSMSTTKLGPRGNSLGIAVDPVTGDVIYPGLSCKPGLISPAPSTCTLYDVNVTTGAATTFASLPTSQVAYVDGIAFDPTGTYLFLTNRFPSYELVVLSRAGSIVRRIPAPAEPVGIGFRAVSPKFVVTNNQNGTMTRFDFPGDDYSAPPVVTEFASGGFRGDLMQAGPDGCLYVTQDGTRYNDFTQDDKANSIVQICGGFEPPPGITPNPPPSPSSLCGYVYNDVDNDGIKEAGDVGIVGVTVNLSGVDSLDVPVSASTGTSSDGSYCFNTLRPGTYTITETQHSAYFDGKDTQGAPGTGTLSNDSFVDITLDAGYNGNNNNFGELLPSSVGGFVYVDADDNGARSAGEAGLAGVTVTLTGTDDRGAPVNMPGVTGTDGAYLFTALRPGTYTITETQPAGYLDGKDEQGTPGTGAAGNDVFSNVVLAQNVTGVANNFGEQVARPSMTLVKKTNGFDNPAAPGRFIPAGAAVTWTYLVTNTGNEPLSMIAVTDDKVANISCPVNVLDPGMGLTCSATGVATAGQYTNTGTVTAQDASGSVVTASDVEFYFGSTSALTIVTRTNGTDNDAGPGPSVVAGSNVTWTYTVTNTGNVALSNLVVSDDKIGSICTAGSLAVGAGKTCTKSGTAVAGPYTNIGTATAKDPAGQTVTVSNPDNYFGVNAVLTLVTKTNGTDNDAGPGPSVLVGGSVTWTYTVSNAGNVALSQVTVTDDKAGAVQCPAATLGPNESMTCTMTGVAVAGPYTNVGVARATDTLGRTISAQNADHYTGVLPPASDLAISMTGPAAATAGSGGLEYRIEVVNKGPSPVNAAVVSVPLPPGMAVSSVPKAPGEWTCASAATTVMCSTPAMKVGQKATISFTATLSCPFPAPAPAATLVTATATSSTDDPAPANNVARLSLSVVNPAPTITGALADPATIWPPNHKMVDVQVSYTVAPACGGTPVVNLGVASNEGNSSDWQILDAHRLNLRSERLGNQKEGRVYTITITATDPTGTSSQKTVLVTVPHDQGKKK